MAIGGMWLSHHGIFPRLRYANGSVIRAPGERRDRARMQPSAVE